MTKRTGAIVAVAVAFLATAVVAVALWPDRDVERSAPESTSLASKTTTEPGATAEPGETGGLGATDPLDGATAGSNRPPGGKAEASTTAIPPTTAPASPSPEAGAQFALQAIPADPPVQPRFKRPPAAGLLFDVDTGEVLWAREATVPRPIASLTKLMTALLVVKRNGPSTPVAVSANAAHIPGSATGLLPAGKQVPFEALLQALIMISANDAAVALAEHQSGTVDAFIEDMNRQATLIGLGCSHFSTPNGLKDRDNYACALDVAALARASLANRRIARVAETRYAKPAFPIKGGRLHLANNHYFLRAGLPNVRGAEVTGLKTGLTDGAGRCYVTTARLGATHLGAVLLDSPDPIRQVPQLLRAGFEEKGALSKT